MILDTFYHVVRGGFDFYGFDVSETESGLLIHEGRIGITSNPLILANDTVDGGWYVPVREIKISPMDRSINLLLDKSSNLCIYSVRQDLDDEVYDGLQYESLLVIASRQDEKQPWHSAKPLRLLYE